MPDLSTLTQAEAQAALTTAGLTLGTVTPQPSTSVPPDQVISQDPACRHQGRQGLAGEHRGVERHAVGVAEPDGLRRRRPQRVRHGLDHRRRTL